MTGTDDTTPAATAPQGAGHAVRVTSGSPTDEEAAAIVAAVEVAWPKPAVATGDDSPPRWRFSGRWWTKPVPLRRSRPW